jgi:PAS domain S-box-containing protein
MNTVHSLNRIFTHTLNTQHHINNAMRCFEETDYDDLFDNMHFVEKLFPGAVTLLCNIQHAYAPFVSSNCNQLFGYSHTEMSGMNVTDFFSHIHPDDIAATHLLFKKLNEYVADAADPAQMRFKLHYRFKHANGHYIHLSDEKLAFRNKKNKYLFFTVFTQDIKPGLPVKMTIHNSKPGSRDQEYIPYKPGRTLTVREKEILNMIASGLTNKEIAARLVISENTVRNHRQKVYEKIGAKNSAEAINMYAASLN